MEHLGWKTESVILSIHSKCRNILKASSIIKFSNNNKTSTNFPFRMSLLFVDIFLSPSMDAPLKKIFLKKKKMQWSCLYLTIVWKDWLFSFLFVLSCLLNIFNNRPERSTFFFPFRRFTFFLRIQLEVLQGEVKKKKSNLQFRFVFSRESDLKPLEKTAGTTTLRLPRTF